MMTTTFNTTTIPAFQKVPKRNFTNNKNKQSSLTTSDGNNKNNNKNNNGGIQQQQQRLPSNVSIIGLGCSSFSTFFWSSSSKSSSDDNDNADDSNDRMLFTVDTICRDHPIVLEWIATIKYAIQYAGITLLDTAPWYGHGTSEIVIGWAIEELLVLPTTTTKQRQQQHEQEQDQDQSELGQDIEDNSNNNNVLLFNRDDIIINTKIGRYEEELIKQFDYSYTMTIHSVKRSIERMKCSYINILQLHDPEFAPTLDILLNETIPAMLYCQKHGYCKALGITGYPLHVQYQIIYESNKKFRTSTDNNSIIWDTALTYGHYNLHDTSLLSDLFINDINNTISYLDYCSSNNIVVLAAAPLSMGLLTNTGPPVWHPADTVLKQSCYYAATNICRNKYNLNISNLALLFAISQPRIPCTILGMKNINEVQTIQTLAYRLHCLSNDDNQNYNHNTILKKILSDNEWQCLQEILDPINGPFAQLGKHYKWDGIEQVRLFWNQLLVDNTDITSNGTKVIEWQQQENVTT